MIKRDKDAIMSEILDVCRDGANKTRIVYQANLNFRTVNPYIELLVKNDLIEIKRGKNQIYEITERGISLLNDLKRVNSQLNEYERAIAQPTSKEI